MAIDFRFFLKNRDNRQTILATYGSRTALLLTESQKSKTTLVIVGLVWRQGRLTFQIDNITII